MTVRDLHKKAMEYNDQAIIAQSKGEDPTSNYLKAYEFEKQAYTLFASKSDEEPTRSVLLRSAASLAMMAGLHSEAEKLIGLAISGNPPEEILFELRDLYKENSKFLSKRKVSARSKRKVSDPSVLNPGDTVTITFTGEVLVQKMVNNASFKSGKLIIFSDKNISSRLEIKLSSPSIKSLEIFRKKPIINDLSQEIENDSQNIKSAISPRHKILHSVSIPIHRVGKYLPASQKRVVKRTPKNK